MPVTYGPPSALAALLSAAADGLARWPGPLARQYVALDPLIGTALMPNPTTIPATLQMTGSPPLNVPGGTLGQVLTSDSAGNLTLQPAPGVPANYLLPSGVIATDTANIQGLINSGAKTIALGAGTFTVNTLTPASGVRITGQGYSATTLQNVSGQALFSMGPAGLLDNVEIDHLTLAATGGDIFSGANVARLHVHDCQLTQLSAANAIWNAPSVTLMIECRFEKNTEHVAGATRGIDAWFLSSPGSANAVNQNVWRDTVCFNDGGDATRYWYHLQSTTGGGANVGNVFSNIVFEHPYGGMVWLESHIRGLVDQCLAYDISSNVANHLIKVSKNATALASNSNTVTNSPRASAATFNAGFGDIGLDVNCKQTTIIAPQAPNSGTTLVLYLGGSTGVKLVNVPPGTSVADSATTAVMNAGAGTAPPAAVVTAGATNECGSVTFGTGTAIPAAPSNLVTVTFGTPFSNVPVVFLTTTKAAAAALQLSAISITATGFTVACNVAPAASQGNTVYGLEWLAVA